METLQVALGRRSYPIYIGGGLLEQAEELLRPLGVGRWAIVCDDTVADLYGAPLACRTGWPLVTFPAGEGSKSLEEYDRLCRRLVQLGLTRSDGIVALGGGVTGDLAGFAAATLLRGVALVQAPTTLLAQVDSAVGGKTGLDLPEGKNLLGCFYQPRIVLADTACLATLPRRQLACGMAEVIKYGCIWDRAFFDFLAAHPSRAEIMAEIEHVLYTCCDIKRQVVMADERDTGLRMILNFGHTIGHAFELAGRYETWTHGQAAGMNWAARLGAAAGVTPAGTAQAITALTEKFGLPADIPCPWNIMAEAVGLDKKRSGDSITLIFLSQLGTTAPTKMKKDELLALLKPMFEK